MSLLCAYIVLYFSFLVTATKTNAFPPMILASSYVHNGNKLVFLLIPIASVIGIILTSLICSRSLLDLHDLSSNQVQRKTVGAGQAFSIYN